MRALNTKSLFGGLLLIIWGIGTAALLWGALKTADYTPNDAVTFIGVAVGGGFIASIAAQLGVALAVKPDDGVGGGVLDVKMRLARRHFDRVDIVTTREGESTTEKGQRTAVTINYVVLGVSVAALVLVGLAFVLLWAFPQFVAVKPGADDLTIAPEYIETQAKAFIALVFAGAGVKVAADT